MEISNHNQNYDQGLLGLIISTITQLNSLFVFLRLRETHNTFQLPVFFFLFFSFSASLIQNNGKFGAKNYFTNHKVMPVTEQLLYQIDKSSHRICSIKKAVGIRKNFAIFT